VGEQRERGGAGDDQRQADQDRRPEPEPEVEHPSGQRGRQWPAQGECGEGQARDERRHAERVLQVRRDVGRQSDQDDADAEGERGGGREQAPTQHPQREHRFGGAALDQHEGAEQHGAGREHGDARRGVPRPGLATLQHAEHHQAHAAGEEEGSEVVDAVRPAVHGLVEVPHEQRGGEQAQGHVDPEDPAPRTQLREHPAQRGADDRRDGPDTGDVALGGGALGDGVDVAGDRDRDGGDRAGAQALDHPEGDEGGHAPGQPAQHAADEEQADPEQDDRFAADRVGELRVDRDRHGLGQQVHREQPRELGEPADVADDRRHGGREDGRVDRDQARGHHQGQQHGPALGAQAHSDPGGRAHPVDKSVQRHRIPAPGPRPWPDPRDTRR
jgi:hypothetical protein